MTGEALTPAQGRVLACSACDWWRTEVSEEDPDSTLGDLYAHLRRHHLMDAPEALVALSKAVVAARETQHQHHELVALHVEDPGSVPTRKDAND